MAPPSLVPSLPSWCRTTEFNMSVQLPITLAQMGWQRGRLSKPSGLKKITEGSLESCLAHFLLNYWTMPHSTTRVSPSELMFGRRLRTHLDLLKPDLSRTVRACQEHQKKTRRSCKAQGPGHRNHHVCQEFWTGTSLATRGYQGVERFSLLRGRDRRWSNPLATC